MPPKQNKASQKKKHVYGDSSDSDDSSQPSPITYEELQNVAPGVWYPIPPSNYTFVNTKPKNLAERIQALKQSSKRRKPRTTYKPKPDTKEYFDSKGSIEQPQNGANVKKDNESCLTCIRQNSKCHGTSVKDGKCLSCQGIGAKKTRQHRICRWKQPQKGVYTYNKHREVNGGLQIARNTNKWKQENEATDTESESEFSYLTIWDFPVGSHTHALLRWLAALLVDNGFLTNDLNLDALANVARARYIHAGRNPQIFPSQQIQQQVMLALNEIYSRLRDMQKNGAVVTMNDILEMLPSDHTAHVERD